MTLDQWMKAYEAEMLECTDCDPMMAKAAAEEALLNQIKDHRFDVRKYADPCEAVQKELVIWGLDK